jgi:hypothetical protein
MKKILLWMQAAILLCGTNMMTSCSNTDIPAPAPQPEWNDQASLFVMKTLSDQRYQKDMFDATMGQEGAEPTPVLRLDVASYEEAYEEFLKLLPEGVAETAYDNDNYYKALFSKSTGFLMNGFVEGETETLFIHQSIDYAISLMGFAWVDLSPKLQAVMGVVKIVYFKKTTNDDLSNFIEGLKGIMPYSKPDTENPTALICTIPATDYNNLLSALFTSKMITTGKVTELGAETTLTDNDGNIYGKLTSLPKENCGDARNVYVMDEALQACLGSQIGMPISKITFYASVGE